MDWSNPGVIERRWSGTMYLPQLQMRSTSVTDLMMRLQLIYGLVTDAIFLFLVNFSAIYNRPGPSAASSGWLGEDFSKSRSCNFSSSVCFPVWIFSSPDSNSLCFTTHADSLMYLVPSLHPFNGDPLWFFSFSTVVFNTSRSPLQAARVDFSSPRLFH